MERGSFLSRRGIVASAVLLLVVFAAEIVSTVRQESLSWDEGDHIFSGYMIWKQHDHGYNPEHPPMVKMLATVPLLGLPLRVPPDQHRYFKAEAYMDGRELLFGNAPYTAESLTLRVRLAAGVLALLLAVFVFLTAQEMFGAGAGIFALAMIVFEPNVLAHSALVATDIAASCFFLATVYAFYRYCVQPGGVRLVVAGVAAGLALTAKHSTVLLLPMLVLLAAFEVAYERRADAWTRRAGRMVAALAAMGIIALVVVWAFYGFRYAARPAGLALDPTLVEYVKPLRPAEAKGILLLARMHIFPESYLYGLADVRSMANGMPSYFFGKVYAHGLWYYFPTVLAIKSTLGFLGLLVVAFAAMVKGRFRQWREIVFLLAPAGLYLLVAMTSHLNIGARHILPVWVFLWVFIAGGAWSWLKGGDRTAVRWGSAIGLLVFLHVASSLKAYPSYMAYANELWGGPSQTHRYLTDSNTDWGQQLLAVKRYTDEQGIKDCWIGYFADPLIRASDYGVPCKPLPTPDDFFWVKVEHPVPLEIEGPVMISAGSLTGFEYGSNVLNPLRSFQELKPSAMIQDGVLVFEGRFRLPLASALSHVLETNVLLKAGKNAEALVEAEMAVKLEPVAVQTQMALGDALKANGRRADAKAAYERVLQVVETMEPGAREEWRTRVEQKISEVS